MKMTKLATLFLTATLTLASGSVLAAETGSSGNGDANAAASAGQVAPDAKQNVAPNNVDNSQINNGNTNTGGTMLHPNGTDSGTMNFIRTPCVKMANVPTRMTKWGMMPIPKQMVRLSNRL